MVSSHSLTGVLPRATLGHMKKSQIKVSIEGDLKAWIEAQAVGRRCSISQVAHEILLKAMKEAPKQ